MAMVMISTILVRVNLFKPSGLLLTNSIKKIFLSHPYLAVLKSRLRPKKSPVGRLIVKDFTISVLGSSCNYLAPLHSLFIAIIIPKA